MNLFTVLLSISLLIILVSESKNFNRSLGTFVLLSILVVGLTGVYSWIVKVDQVDSLTYIHSPEWSDDYLFSDIPQNCFATAIDHEQNLHIVWGAYHRGPQRKMYLKHLATNPQGELIVPPHTILETEQIQRVSLAIPNEQLEIFWAGKGTGEGLDLIHTQVDMQGELTQQETLRPDLFSYKITDLTLTTGKEALLLAWIDKVGAQFRVQSLLIPATQMTSDLPEPKSLAQSTSTLSQLKLTHDQSGQFHLLWQDQLTATEDQLFYQRLTSQGEPNSEAFLVDQGQLGTNTLTTTSQKVVLAWDKSLGNNPGVIFGASLPLAEVPTEIEAHRLTMEEHRSTMPALATTSSDQIYFTYVIKKFVYISAMAFQKYDPDFTPLMEKDEWVLPKQIRPDRQELISGSGDDIYLYWFESSRPTDFQSVNNQHLRQINPFDIVGLKTSDLLDSLFISVTQVFSSPVFDFTIHFILFFNIVSLGFTAAILGRINLYLRRKLNFTLFHQNLYLVTTLLCLVQLFNGHLILGVFTNELVSQQLTEHFWFIMSATFLASWAYIALNKMRDQEFMFGAFVGIAWIYWVLLAAQVLNLPYINFTILPNL